MQSCYNEVAIKKRQNKQVQIIIELSLPPSQAFNKLFTPKLIKIAYWSLSNVKKKKIKKILLLKKTKGSNEKDKTVYNCI